MYERNYASMKGELCAVIYGLRKFEHILRFKQFKIRTNNSALTYLARWLNEVQSYDFIIEHVPGKQNSADHISRSSHLPLPSEEEIKEEVEYLDKISAMDDIAEQLSKDALIKEQKEDVVVSIVREWVQRDRRSLLKKS